MVLLNSDVAVEPRWLQPLAAYMDVRTPKWLLVSPKYAVGETKAYFEYAGASGGFLDAYGYPFCRGRIFSSVEKDDGQYDAPIPVSGLQVQHFLFA